MERKPEGVKEWKVKVEIKAEKEENVMIGRKEAGNVTGKKGRMNEVAKSIRIGKRRKKRGKLGVVAGRGKEEGNIIEKKKGVKDSRKKEQKEAMVADEERKEQNLMEGRKKGRGRKH